MCIRDSVQIDGLLSSRIVDTYLYLMAEHAGHGVAYFIHQCYSCRDVNQWIGGDHAFVHSIKGQQVPGRIPESAF